MKRLCPVLRIYRSMRRAHDEPTNQGERVAISTGSHYDEITAAFQGICNRLDTLASINAENMLIPGRPQERYHQIVEEAYAALGLIETKVDELRAELEYQHKRLDEAGDAAFAEALERQEQPR
jgi:hypothetical protein